MKAQYNVYIISRNINSVVILFVKTCKQKCPKPYQSDKCRICKTKDETIYMSYQGVE